MTATLHTIDDVLDLLRPISVLLSPFVCTSWGSGDHGCFAAGGRGEYVSDDGYGLLRDICGDGYRSQRPLERRARPRSRLRLGHPLQHRLRIEAVTVDRSESPGVPPSGRGSGASRAGADHGLALRSGALDHHEGPSKLIVPALFALVPYHPKECQYACYG